MVYKSKKQKKKIARPALEVPEEVPTVGHVEEQPVLVATVAEGGLDSFAVWGMPRQE